MDLKTLVKNAFEKATEDAMNGETAVNLEVEYRDNSARVTFNIDLGRRGTDTYGDSYVTFRHGEVECRLSESLEGSGIEELVEEELQQYANRIDDMIKNASNMKDEYKNMEEFFNDICEHYVNPLEVWKEYNWYTKKGNTDFAYVSWYGLMSDINDGSKDYWDEARKETYSRLPIKVVEYQHASDTDMDHGGVTDTYVVQVGNKFYTFDFEFFGQGEFFEDETQWNSVEEVFPKTITKVIYERKVTT